MKYDEGRAPMHLVPPEAIKAIAEVFAFGAEKYSPNNWRFDGGTTDHSRTYASIQRHLNSYWSGVDLDPESGQLHLAHALTQCMILLIHVMDNPEMDDRYTTIKRENEENERK